MKTQKSWSDWMSSGAEQLLGVSKMAVPPNREGAVPTERSQEISEIEQREIDMVKQTAKDLAFDTVYYVSNLKKLRPGKHAETMRRTVDDLFEKHQILFVSMVNKLQITEEDGKDIFMNVANEMFRDGQINWGRLATVYALAGRMAKYCAEKNMVKYVDKIAEFTGEYVSEKFARWIHSEGGWVC